MTENRRGLQRSSNKVIAIAVAIAAGGLLGPAARTQERSRQHRTEPVTAIRAAAVTYVKSQLPPSEIADISAGGLDDRLRLARCATALLVVPTGSSATARSTVGVSCAEPRWMVYVPVTVVRHVPVLILRHAVARGAHLTPDDVMIQTRKVSGFASAYLGGPAELRGRSVERTLAAGTSLTMDMFTQDPVVRRGQEVTLVAKGEGIEVRAAGRALQDAPAGGRLQVENLSSQKIVEGVVESSDTVQVAD
jgi:flagella basal body P-ring formation protein FlgA